MPILLEPYWNTLKSTDLPVHRLTVDEYHQMIDAKIIEQEDGVELLDGLIVREESHSAPHDGCVTELQEQLRVVPPTEWIIRIQMPIVLDTSEPKPDVVLAKGTRRDYFSRKPIPADIGMLVEVSDGVPGKDRHMKHLLYGHSLVPIYWIVNIPDAQVEVYTNPTGPSPIPGYEQRRVFCRGESVPVIVDGKEYGRIAVNDLLP